MLIEMYYSDEHNIVGRIFVEFDQKAVKEAAKKYAKAVEAMGDYPLISVSISARLFDVYLDMEEFEINDVDGVEQMVGESILMNDGTEVRKLNYPMTLEVGPDFKISGFYVDFKSINNDVVSYRGRVVNDRDCHYLFTVDQSISIRD